MKNIRKSTLAYLLATLLADVILFGFTNPSKVGSIWLAIGFGLAVVNIYWLARGLVVLLGLYSHGLRRQSKRLVRIITVTAGILVALQSMGQLSLRDVAVLVPLAVIAYFYFSYGRAKQGV